MNSVHFFRIMPIALGCPMSWRWMMMPAWMEQGCWKHWRPMNLEVLKGWRGCQTQMLPMCFLFYVSSNTWIPLKFKQLDPRQQWFFSDDVFFFRFEVLYLGELFNRELVNFRGGGGECMKSMWNLLESTTAGAGWFTCFIFRPTTQ